jgi:PhnB protein
MTNLNAYLGFGDTARAAMEHYLSVFGGELTVTTFGEGGMSQEPGESDKVMHAQLSSPIGLLMGADTPAGMERAPGGPHSMSLSGDDEAELRGYWDKLSDGGTITMPLEKAPWGDSFGMCTDRFGIPWMVNISGA